ncbi:hypothetical protein ACT9ST_23425 [Sphingobium limneticum]
MIAAHIGIFTANVTGGRENEQRRAFADAPPLFSSDWIAYIL